MPLPPSYSKDGFISPANVQQKRKLPNGQYLKPLLIGTEGETDTGKTEFALSIPGKIQMISVDRNFTSVLDNPDPPEARNPNVGLKVHEITTASMSDINGYQKSFQSVKESFYAALNNPDSSVVFLDGDSDYWELHVLAHFGKNTQIFPQTRYAAPYAEKRAQINRAWDSGKIVICTNKVRDEYVTVYKADGTPEKDDRGEEVRRKTENKKRQGFPDQDYLWQVQLRHMYKPAGTYDGKFRSNQWGIKLLKCKHNPALVGEELWGDKCNFRGLVDFIYPDVAPERWGF